MLDTSARGAAAAVDAPKAAAAADRVEAGPSAEPRGVLSRAAAEANDKPEPAAGPPDDDAGSADADAGDVFKPWTREQVLALRARQPVLSPWRVVAAQALAGLACAGMAALIGPRFGVSALYGASAVVLPAALLARGMTRRSSGDAAAAAVGFVVWETIKIGVAVAMLAAAPRVVRDLSWPAMLVAMVVCMKMNWLALLWRGRT